MMMILVLLSVEFGQLLIFYLVEFLLLSGKDKRRKKNLIYVFIARLATTHIQAYTHTQLRTYMYVYI